MNLVALGTPVGEGGTPGGMRMRVCVRGRAWSYLIRLSACACVGMGEYADT